jgi:hypothetical protein
MERIIRSNAVKTSLEAGNWDKPDKLPSASKFSPPLANIYQNKSNHNPQKHAIIYGGADSEFTEGIALPSRLSNTVKTSRKTSTNANSGNWSTLEAMFNQPPSAIPYLVLLSSIAFFTIVLAWIWSLRIEEVSHLHGKFIPLIDTQKVFKVTKQEVTMAAERQGQQNYSGLMAEIKTQKQQLMSIQTGLNHTKALMGAVPSKLITDSQPNEQLDLIYAVESSQGLMLSNNSTENRFAAISTAHNTVNDLKQDRSAIRLQSLLPLATPQQIQKLAKDVTQLQNELIETENRINAIELNLKQRRTHSKKNIDQPQPKKSSNRKIFPSTQTLDTSQSLVLMSTLSYQQAEFLRPGDRVQIKLNTYSQHHQNIISGKVLSIIPEPGTKIYPENHAALFRIIMEQDLPMKKQLQSLKTNQIATAKISYRHRIADIFFDTND